MSISADDFKNVLRHFPAGVTVVTVKSGDEIHGFTVSAFASVSPTPPLILICADHRGRGHELLERSDAVFAVNILAEGQDTISSTFAFGDGNRFENVDWSTATTGAPVLYEALAWLDCTVYSRHTAGTHTIYIGQVQDSRVITPEQAPLIYWNRSYRSIADAPSDNE